MKKLIHSVTCLLLLGTGLSRGDDLPFFSALREEVVSQLTIASNTPPLDKKLVSGLSAQLKLIDRTKPTLITGSASLGTLAKGLGRTSLSNTFLPLLMETHATYLDAMDTERNTLEERLDATIPGKVQTAGRTAIGKLSVPLEDARTNASFTLALKSLSKAAKAVAAAQKAVVKSETAPPGANFLLATITESNFSVFAFKPTTKTILDATYDPFLGEIDIDAGSLENLGGGRVNVRFLSLTAIVPGPGSHTLSLTNLSESNAYYQRGIIPNIHVPDPAVESEETFPTVDPFNHRFGTGTLNITYNPDANLVWGDFTFTATSLDHDDLTVSMSGSFLLRLEVFE